MSKFNWIISIAVSRAFKISDDSSPRKVIRERDDLVNELRPPSMKCRNDDALRRQEPREVRQPGTRDLPRSVREERPDPDDVKTRPEVDFRQIFDGMHRRGTKVLRAEFDAGSIEVERVKGRTGEEVYQVSQHAAMSARDVEHTANLVDPRRNTGRRNRLYRVFPDRNIPFVVHRVRRGNGQVDLCGLIVLQKSGNVLEVGFYAHGIVSGKAASPRRLGTDCG